MPPICRSRSSRETVCRKLNGESFALEDEVQRCFDIHPQWVPEERLKRLTPSLRRRYPAKGLVERMEALRTRYELAREKAALLPGLLRLTMDE